ncbi:GNAT family N-acetyltransferase [Rugamonas aquatica]|uniref:GNAT family N-acetyltransferase n=1 Tax=Rugamonas aquatica TaxID=2743357 RepID=A0A6A7N5T9_9BURK|nr:GNAT family N-acetyltransferase [Rugamonas aquatica]MQA40242.1 GNAT family N-acetyltransferase [Rugamonas aquatica]
MKILDTERLTLRTITPDDAGFYYDLVNDPTWLEFIGDKGIRSIEGARDAIIEGPCAMQERLGHSLYVMERKSDGVALGLCGLIKRDELDHVDIGYAIRPAWFGMGYTYEAAVAVVAYARDTLRMRCLLGLTDPGNINSIRLLAKLGLAFVELRTLPPRDRPSNIYRIDFPN